MYIWWEKIGASLRSFLVLKITHVPIVEEFGCGGLTLGAHMYNWKDVERF